MKHWNEVVSFGSTKMRSITFQNRELRIGLTEREYLKEGS
jgi:hypothetical protein